MDRPPPAAGYVGGAGAESIRARTMRLLMGIAGFAIAGITLFSIQFGLHLLALTVAATSLSVAVASTVGGALVGFLFGIPRGRRAAEIEQPHGTPAMGDLHAQSLAAAQRASDIRSNTNLEDISDWLTKILVGVGLTQLGAIGRGLGRLAQALAPALGGVASSQPYGLALVVSFLVIGFLTGYLWTRLFLPAVFQRAESERD